MPRRPRALPTLVLALALAACAPVGTGAPAPKPGATTKPGTGPSTSLPPVAANAVATLIGMDGGSLIGLDASSLIGQDGGSVIGQNGGSLVASGGGGQQPGPVAGEPGNMPDVGSPSASLIGQDGGSLIGQDGGSITGTVMAPAGLLATGKAFQLLAAAPKPLAGVNVYLMTADGKIIADAQRKPITAVTDAQGRYDFKAYKALRGVAVFVPTAAASAAGELRGLVAIRPIDMPGTGPGLTVDVASSLTASWVFDRVLAGLAKPRTALDRLTSALESEARARAAALGGEVPDGLRGLGRKALAGQLEAARAKDPALDAALDKIVRTVAGRSNAENDFGATTLTLQQPTDVAIAPDGAVFVVEGLGGIMRRFPADGGPGTIVLGPGSPSEAALGALEPTDVAITQDGRALYVAAIFNNTVIRLGPDGAGAKVVLGGGNGLVQDGARGSDVRIAPPTAVAVDQDGSLLVGEDLEDGAPSRLLRLKPDGTIELLPAPWGDAPVAAKEGREVAGLAVDAQGTWWCLELDGREVHMKPKGGAWRSVARGLTVGVTSDLLPLPGGGVLVSLGERSTGGAHGIDMVAADGTVTRWAGLDERGGTDGPGATASFGMPSGLARRPDGTVLVADRDNGLVRKVAPDAARTVGVAFGLRGGAPSIPLDAPLNVPGGLAVDGQGRLVVTEFASNTIRRLEGDRLVRIAGGTSGLSGATGPAPADRLLRPAGIAYDGDVLYVAENGNHLVRKLRPDGMIETVAGGGTVTGSFAPPAGTKARDRLLGSLSALAVGPDGVYFSEADWNDSKLGHIWRIGRNGELDLIAGAFSGDVDEAGREGKPAAGARIGLVNGMCFDQAGNLYATEATAQIIKIDPKGVLTAVAGVGFLETASRIIGGLAQDEPAEMAAREAALLLPTGIDVDAAGNLIVAEFGTRVGQAIAIGAPGAEGLPVLDGRIRMITPDGRIRTLAGRGAPNASVRVRSPVDLVVTPAGKIYFVDNGSNQIQALE